MAQQIIGIGAAPNDNTGDPLRTAFDKTNDNFTELYTGDLSSVIVVKQASDFGVIDSTKEYLIDGVIDMTGVSIEIPSGGMYIRGLNFDLSKLVNTESAYTMFTSPVGGSGNVLFNDIGIEVSGSLSKVYELKSLTGNEAIECNIVNYNNCTSLGSLNNFRQGLEVGTGRFGGTPSLELIGAWNGFRVTTSIARGVDDAMTEPIFKAGLGFTISGRFLTDINIDLGTLAPLSDFSQSNFLISDSFEIERALISRSGVFNPMDATILPNISSTDSASLFVDNVGITNTHKGGVLNITAETTTNIISTGAYVNLDGTWTSSDLDHFDSPSNGQLRFLDKTPRSFKLNSQLILDGGANDECSVKVEIWRNATSTFETKCIQNRLVDNLQGGRDVAYFNIYCSFTLYENDYVKLMVANLTNTTDVKAELDSYFVIEKR